MPLAIIGTVVTGVLGLASLVVNVLQYRARQRTKRELEVARGSKLVCKNPRASKAVERVIVSVQREHGGPLVDEEWSQITYKAELAITNQSERPNSIVSFHLHLSGLDGPFPGIVSPSDERLMASGDSELGEPLLLPVNIPAGVCTVRGFVVFQVDVDPDQFNRPNLNALQFAILIRDGHGQTYQA